MTGLPFLWWAAWCPKCQHETCDEPRCGDCGTDLRGQPTRGEYDEHLTPELVRVLLDRAKKAA